MRTNLPPAFQPRRQGFSLVELLTAIAVIGIIASIAVINLNPQTRFAEARDRRNAQEIASLCEAARAAGLDFIVADDLDATLVNVQRGGAPQSGPLKGRFFALRGMDPEAVKTASRFLKLSGTTLRLENNSIEWGAPAPNSTANATSLPKVSNMT